MKCKLIIFFLVVFTTAYSQQDFKFKYNFKKILSQRGVTLNVYDKAEKKYFLRTTSLTKLNGVLSKFSEERDTLFIRLWPNDIPTDTGHPTNLSESDNYSKFIILVDENSYPTVRGYKGFDLPFTSWQLFAVNIPLRFNLKDGTVGSEFINANISFSRIWGRTRIFKSEFIKPRNLYGGAGIFAGFGGIKNSKDEDEVGINYGFNTIFSIYNINLIGTIGLETGLSKYGVTNPFAGVGIGFDLFSITGTDPKNEE